MVNTVLGPVAPSDLGVTLMHEHLLIGWVGWQMDSGAPAFQRKEALKLCVDRMQELKDLGVRTFLDPCAIDIGRDVEFMAEVSQASGVHIICATGLYHEHLGSTAYFRFRAQFSDAVAEMAEVFTRELTQGIGTTGIKAGIIKVATQANTISPYEEMVLRAAARVSKATGARITTHTDDGTMGREQLDLFAAEGADLRRVIIGHSCGSADLRYHTDMLDRGCYLGFDRFGLDFLQPDRLRKAALIGLVGIGFHNRIVLSHDTVWCTLGRPLPLPADLIPNWYPTHVFKNIIPALREAGVAQGKIDAMLIHNPREFFTD